MDDYELARVVGRIHFPEDLTTPSLDVSMPDESTQYEPPVYVGDVRLSEFRKILQAEGIQAEFKGEGILVCNEQVAVRKVIQFIFIVRMYVYYLYDVDGHWTVISRRNAII